MAADSTPGMMLWSRRQAAVFRLGSLLLMMYESNSWKTSVGEAGSGRKRQEAAGSGPSAAAHRVGEVIAREEHLQELPQRALGIGPTCVSQESDLVPHSGAAESALASRSLRAS